VTSSNRKLGLFLFNVLNLKHVYNRPLFNALSGSQASVRLSYARYDVRTGAYRAAAALRLRCALLRMNARTVQMFWKTIFAYVFTLAGS
jgi:hypothetical protein